MTVRDDVLPALDAARTLCDVDIGLRQNAVSVTVRTWTSGKIGTPATQAAGTDYTDATVRLFPNPKVRRVTQREVASSGGQYEDSDLVVGPVTPAFLGGGYTLDQLKPLIRTKAVQLIFMLAGPNAGEYEAIDQRRDRPMRYEVVVRRTRRTP